MVLQQNVSSKSEERRVYYFIVHTIVLQPSKLGTLKRFHHDISNAYDVQHILHLLSFFDVATLRGPFSRFAKTIAAAYE